MQLVTKIGVSQEIYTEWAPIDGIKFSVLVLDVVLDSIPPLPFSFPLVL